MKGKNTPELPSKVSIKESGSNLFLNIIILLLGAVVIFLAYSLIINLFPQKNEIAEEKNIQKTSQIIQLEVLNGCGVSGVADKFTSYLRSGGFDVVQSGNYMSFDIEKSLVIDRIGNRANALKVAKELGIDEKQVIQQLNNDYFLDVSLVVGKDFPVLKPYQKD